MAACLRAEFSSASIREGKYDVLHFHLQASNWLMKPLAALAGAPVRISHDHTSGDLKFRGIEVAAAGCAFRTSFPRGSSRCPTGVRDFLTRWEAVPRESVVVIANGVDDSTFRPRGAGEDSGGGAGNGSGLPADAFVVGGMGRLAYEKNFCAVPELGASGARRRSL